ncbi:MAG: polyphenol oxidase family protein [Phycisphaerae bacterium]
MTGRGRDALTSEEFFDTALLRFPALDALGSFSHAITTRPWNMAPHRGPDAERAVERRRRVCDHLGFAFERLTAPEQIHGGLVIPVASSDVGAGRFGREGAVRFVDGLVCDRPGVPVLQLSADCPLIVAVDPEGRAFGVAHASWRGTVARIAEALVGQMVDAFDTHPDGLLVAICPCAGPDRYEVGDDLRRVACAALRGAERYFPRGSSGRCCFDLRAANVDQLLGAGVRKERIHVAEACTIGDERFYSHRREGERTGRFAVIAGFHE